MGFLAGLAAQVLEWVLSKLFAWISRDIADANAQAAQKRLAEAEAAALAAAKTQKQVEDAAKDSLNNI